MDECAKKMGLSLRNDEENFGFSGKDSSIIRSPWAVTFNELLITDPAQRPGINIDKFPNDEMRQCVQYISEWNQAEAALLLEDRLQDPNKEMKKAYALLEQKPEAVVKANADAGDDLEALEYGIRLRAGFGCVRNARWRASISSRQLFLLRSTIVA